jgi:hypothetical protein
MAIKEIKRTFQGCRFQCRLATDPAYTTALPRSRQSGGQGWTFAYNETKFDRVIRLSNPVDLRNGLVDGGWSDARVASVSVDRGRGAIFLADPVLGSIVSLGDAKFQSAPPGNGPTKEALVDFRFSIGVLLKADAASIPVSPGLDPPGGTPALVKQYLKKKPAAISGINLDPDREDYLNSADELPTPLERYADKYQYRGPYPGILLNNVTFNHAQGLLKEMGNPGNYQWVLDLAFYQFDGDTLVGLLDMDLTATA